MKLKEYLTYRCVSSATFAERLREQLPGKVIDPVTVYRYAAGTRRPRTDVEFRAIYLASEGLVTPNDFYGLPGPKPVEVAA